MKNTSLRTYNVKFWLPFIAVCLILLITLSQSVTQYHDYVSDIESQNQAFAANIVTDLALILNRTIANDEIDNIQSL
jgi:hypothetical protein